MTDLNDGESTEMKGSGIKPYVLKNIGGVYSCSCPAWMNQSIAIERRTCKHLKKLRGEAVEAARVGAPAPAPQLAPGDSDDEGATDKAPPLLLAHSWQNDIDLAGWWMSEKLDGVRAYWDGTKFLSRLGNVYHAPDWFTERLPSVPLDGELWCGRKKFQRCVSIVRRQDKSDHWKELSFVVFDAPAIDAPFEDRIAHVGVLFAETAPVFARRHDHARCESIGHLREELARVEALGGEGLMLREPGSRYEVGRSATLLKVKSFKDAEARVVDHVAGAGRHKGRVGALVVELDDGTRFSVGTGLSDAERAAPPPVGSIVAFRYQELSDGGVPRFPSFVGVRHDVVLGRAEPATVPATAAASFGSSPTPVPANVNASSLGESRVFRRSLQLVEGTSAKFWEVEVVGSEQTVRFGRIGTAGQTKSKSFASEEAARSASEALTAEKLRKGYAPTGDGDGRAGRVDGDSGGAVSATDIPRTYGAPHAGVLPSEATTSVLDIPIPRGRAVEADPDYATGHARSGPLVWVSVDPVEDLGALIASLAARFSSSGLWPFGLTALDDDEAVRPWLTGEFDPGGSSSPADHDAHAVLAEWWHDALPIEAEGPEALASVAPFRRKFPGLAAATKASRKKPSLADLKFEGRLGLIPVTRPADAVAAIGWMGPVNFYGDMGKLSAVLRSWEDRFGAYVVDIGFDTLTLFVERPPTTKKAALATAAEHFAACPDNINQGSGSLEEYAEELVGSQVWQFWWD